MAQPLLLSLGIALLWAVVARAKVLNPPYFNLAEGRQIKASATCGELDPVTRTPMLDTYCSLSGANAYNPWGAGQYGSHNYEVDDSEQAFAELRIANDGSGTSESSQSASFVQDGQNCGRCNAALDGHRHPASFMVDGTSRWWQSPPLSRGFDFSQVNITINLEQEFHVAYVSIQMANSPRPAAWILERSTDHGKTWQPWQYFAESASQCEELFGPESLQEIYEDDDVICTTDHSQIVPLENGQIFVRLLSDRPSINNFTHSEKLQLFTRATNVRLRLLKTKTLQGHLMDLSQKKNPTVTRRYFYSIKEIEMGGRCVCHGHAKTCDILDPRRPSRLLCRCEHNTCGDQCEMCCPGFEQKAWKPSRDGQTFQCEPCNCHGHSRECVYDPELDKMKKSLDIHGRKEGGGRCQNCRDNTQGINCNECVHGFYRPNGKFWNETDVCRRCNCNPRIHTMACAEGTGNCFCKQNFTGADCSECAPGYYDPLDGAGSPDQLTCLACECNFNGTAPGPDGEKKCRVSEDETCDCTGNFGGRFCDRCANEFFNFPTCTECQCDLQGSVNRNCSQETGQCVCKMGYSGLNCTECKVGYYGYPDCQPCDCDPSGSEEGMCQSEGGKCLCKPGFGGPRCDQCLPEYYAYPACRSCDCAEPGSGSGECDEQTGKCACGANFTGRTCDRCSPGFYDYPNCYACECDSAGSKGVSCDGMGQCFCKSNFAGEKCEKCRANFYNYPVCEECNCDPRGVSRYFAGCDKVPPGELCTCKEKVGGRICDECLPTFWNLNYHNPQGCEDCACYRPGTLSSLNVCDDENGQCFCKPNVAGRACRLCKDGFFKLEGSNSFGCNACHCDIGGSYSNTCDQASGQCLCRPRIHGMDCTDPIDNHYVPRLWHNKLEAEEGRTPENKPVRFAIDEEKFPNFSWTGFGVFSPIQQEIILTADISKPSMYQILFHYVNPTTVDIVVDVAMDPIYTESDEAVKQELKVTLPPTKDPRTLALSPNGAQFPYAFVLTPKTWNLRIKTEQRIFLDYVVLLPSEYYEAPLLKEEIRDQCKKDSTEPCLEMTFPTLPSESSLPAADLALAGDGGNLPAYPDNEDMRKIASVGPEGATVEGEMKIAQPGEHYLVLVYTNDGETSPNLTVEATVGDSKTFANALLHLCPYRTSCRELITENGEPKVYILDGDTAKVSIQSNGPIDIGLDRLVAIPVDEWDATVLTPALRCPSKEGNCMAQIFPDPASYSTAEAEDGEGATGVSGDDIPFQVVEADPAENPAGDQEKQPISLVPLDLQQGPLDVIGEVPTESHYIFIVHYFNPEGTKSPVDTILLNDKDYEMKAGEPFNTTRSPLVNETQINAYFTAEHCPSASGCRAVIRSKVDDLNQFHVPEKYLATFFPRKGSKSPVYIDKVVAVPFQNYKEELLEPMDREGSGKFVRECSDNYFNAETMSEFCKDSIFSLTADFNGGALPCGCDPQGSTGFGCEKLGGQCGCRENVIGPHCSICRPGYYGFPNCRPCNCGKRQCNPSTGQCECPLHVEGKNCERCEIRAFGYDALIGCQLCQCHPDGSEGGRLECDPMSGQCLCKMSVGGRKCDECLAGNYGFPQCYECNCDPAGTKPQICDQRTAQCLCKSNAMDQTCDSCKPGTFNMQPSNVKACSECFCFGVTNQCQSSNWGVSEIENGIVDWTSTRPTEANVGKNPKVSGMNQELNITNEDFQGDIYFVAPTAYLGKQINSYGGNITYEVRSEPEDEKSQMGFAPDIVISSHNLTIEFWSEEQAPDPKEYYRITAPLEPNFWKIRGGGMVTRSQLMMVLIDVTELQLKASYYHPIKYAAIKGVKMDTADPSNLIPIGRVEDPQVEVASAVEVCQCPPPYQGSSCEECADGYYRVKTGNFLGSCVPCRCNNHARTCDRETGECLSCEHNTMGFHCETCSSGYYGDPTRGSPHDCQLCACPHPTVQNNFATSCSIDPFGRIQDCKCKEGYTGETCERCDTGYFGEPIVPGQTCRECFCNGNNDLSVTGSCDHISGTCLNCANFTTGYECQQCEPWYYGDAIDAKNCSECSCDKCGSEYCDISTGRCECKVNVGGKNCDSCVENAWGFSRCGGCRMCDCGIASVGKQCDLQTGQCPCMLGTEGTRCDRCKNGFWDYGPTGCKPCDCEADLSEGTVCDVNTGHCQCQEGATGPRCDMCIEGYLRIPKHGCLYCEECVHVLKDDLETLGYDLIHADQVISNVSAEHLTGIRLGRINATLFQLEPRIKASISATKDLGLANLVGSVKSTRDRASQLAVSAERKLNSSKDSERSADELVRNGGELMDSCREAAAASREAVDSMSRLAESLGKQARSVDRDSLAKQGQAVLDEMKARNFENVTMKAKAELEEAEKTRETVEAFKNKMYSARNESADAREILMGVDDKVQDQMKELNEVKTVLEEAERLTTQVVSNPLYLAPSKLGDEADQLRENLDDGSASLQNAQYILSGIQNLKEETTNEIKSFNETHMALKERVEEEPEPEEVDLPRIIHEAKIAAMDLEREAQILDRDFAGTRDSSGKAVEAAKAYSTIEDAIQEAKAAANEATDASQPSSAPEQETDGSAVESETQSMALLREAGDSRSILTNNITMALEGEKKKIKTLASSLKAASDGLKDIEQDTGTESAANAAIEKARDAQQRAKEVEQFVSDLQPKLENIQKEGQSGVDDVVETEKNKKIARQQLEEALQIIPNATEQLGELQSRAKNASLAQDKVILKLDSLRKRIAQARDLANRVRVGAKFTRGSSLKLKNPARLTRSAAYTLIGLYFKTRDDGLLFFLGNQEGSGGTRHLITPDYLAAEIEGGVIKVVMDLGGGPFQLRGNERISDDQWHKLEVERTGKVAKITVTTENRPEPSVITGSYDQDGSVLNLHKDISGLYIGGVPNSHRTPRNVRSRNFVGVIEDVTYHDVPLGLWNFDRAGIVNVDGARPRDELRTSTTDSGVRLDGKGYVVMNRGMWNPRKATTISFQFKSLGWDALFFYIGKEKDFLSVELENGKVVLRYDLGKGIANIRSQNVYNDGEFHVVSVSREETEAVLIVDEVDKVEGESAKGMFELSVGDVYYIGGMPPSVTETRVTREGLSGCINMLTLETMKVSLIEAARSSMGVKAGCPATPIRVVGLKTPSFLEFGQQKVQSDLKFSLRFRTENEKGLLAYISNADGTNRLTLVLDSGFLSLTSQKGEETKNIRIELASATDGMWHFVSLERNRDELVLHVDDLYSKSERLTPNELTESEGVVRFGMDPDSKHPAFVGCLGDVTINGVVRDFASVTSRTVEAGSLSMVGCHMSEPIDDLEEELENVDGEVDLNGKERSLPPPLLTTPGPAHQSSDLSCALGKVPVGMREDTTGRRYGTIQHSRREYKRLPEAFDASGVFSFDFRATASNGIVFLAMDEDGKDHISVYMIGGRIAFSYDSGSGSAIIKSKRTYLDAEWHHVQASRRQKEGLLKIDEYDESTGVSPGENYAVDTTAPFYVGGIPADKFEKAANKIENVSTVFGGCLRNFKLNNLEFEDPSYEVNEKCSKMSESGYFFGSTEDPTYAMLKDTFKVGASVSWELSIKPRVKNAVILSVLSNNGSSFLSLVLHEGDLHFQFDNGDGVNSVSYSPEPNQPLCDGHWHLVKIVKKKNLMILAVDGKSSMKFMKTKETDTAGNVYMGGVPEGHTHQGLKNRESYVGCIRLIKQGKRTRRKKDVDLAVADRFGDIRTDGCPVN